MESPRRASLALNIEIKNHGPRHIPEMRSVVNIADLKVFSTTLNPRIVKVTTSDEEREKEESSKLERRERREEEDRQIAKYVQRCREGLELQARLELQHKYVQKWRYFVSLKGFSWCSRRKKMINSNGVSTAEIFENGISFKRTFFFGVPSAFGAGAPADVVSGSSEGGRVDACSSGSWERVEPCRVDG